MTAIVLFLPLAACVDHEGKYEPACIAYEGDTIELRGGRFEWHRFTDQRAIDANGNVVDPFPGFPKTGAYEISGARLQLVTTDGADLDDWYRVTHAGEQYLLTETQHNVFVERNEIHECALKRVGSDSN